MESKQYSWAWVTADQLLSHGPCELVYVYAVPDTAASATVDIYNGESSAGDKILGLKTAELRPLSIKPEPIYCRKGLYIDILTNIKGIFVQWRELK